MFNKQALQTEKLYKIMGNYIDYFNRNDDELYKQYIYITNRHLNFCKTIFPCLNAPTNRLS